MHRITQNYVNYVGTIESTDLNVKQLANRPAHLPRVQVPVHINMLDMEFLEYTIKGDPRTWLKYTKYTELLLNWTEQALHGVILHVC